MSPNLVCVAAPLALVLSVGSSASAQAPPLRLALPGTLPAPDVAPAHGSRATAQPTPVTNGNGDWQFVVYPILAWVPINIGIEVTGPFDNGVSGGSGELGGKIVDGRFDGAFLAGFSATNGTWRVDFDGVYAAVGGDRVTPDLTVDVNLIYAHATVEREIAGGFFVTGGVRRFALKYDINFLDYDTFTRKPGIWDPLVGVAYHKLGDSVQFHTHAEYGGFGVGSDHDFGVGVRVDWKPWDHFGFTAGYNLVTFRFTQDVGPFEFKAKQTVSGPVVGIGLYF